MRWKMEKLLSNLKLENNNENLISLTLFGSYNTKYWFEGKSDIDILALVKRNDFNIEFEIENRYREVLQKYFNYDDIHFTFIGLNSFDTVFADIYIDYKDKLIFNISKNKYDFNCVSLLDYLNHLLKTSASFLAT